MGRARPGDELLVLTRCYSYMKPLKGGSPSVAKPTTLGHKEEHFCFHIF